MSQQNNMSGTSTPSDLPVKRKRGRPRKDKNVIVIENPQLALTPASDNIQEAELNQSTHVDENMVGQVVSGVIEGSFDSGYLLSVRIGNSSTLLRGAVFQPGKVSPVTAVNDVAPDVKMYKMRDSPFPAVNPSCQANGSVLQSVHTIEQPLQLQNQVPIAPNQVVPPVLQSSAPVALSNPSAPVSFPLNNLPQNVNGPLAGKTTPKQKPEFEVLSESSSVTALLTNVSNIEADMSMGVMKVIQQQNSDFRFQNQPASTMVPMSNMPNNVSSTSLDVGKVALQPTQQFAFENQSPPLLKNLKMVEQDEVMQVFEAPTSEPMVDIFSGNKTSDQLPPVLNLAEKSEVELHQTSPTSDSQFLLSEPQTESEPCQTEQVHNDLHNSNNEKSEVELHQTSPTSDSQFLLSEPQTESEPCQTEQVHNDLHNSNNELLQTPAVTYSQLVPKESEYVDSGVEASELMHTKIADSNLKLNENTLVAEPQLVIPEPIPEPTSEPMDIEKDVLVSPTKEEQPEPTEKELSKYETSHNGKHVHDVGGSTEAVSHPSPGTEVALPAKPAEESGFSGIIDSKIASSPIHNTDMDFPRVEAQSQC